MLYCALNSMLGLINLTCVEAGFVTFALYFPNGHIPINYSGICFYYVNVSILIKLSQKTSVFTLIIKSSP